ncbi:VOC family protein [Fontibacillus panacisegetis]|nr:VOC family protein [Fontibacillus panacisegetis]
MIQKLGQVMLYVNDQAGAVSFWTEKAGFVVIAEEDHGQGMRSIEIAPAAQSATTLVLHNKELVAKMSPELNLGTPSLMFFADDVERLYAEFTEKGITVGELVDLPMGKVFNFADDEGNYFAVLEKK